LKVKEPVALLPAASVQLPETVTLAPSGSLYVWAAVHESTPEVASLPLVVNVTAWLYQPLWSGPRSGLTVTTGAVAS
jgi:hypothetical protein